MAATPVTLADAFDPRRNSLDFLRFAMAALVVFSHAFVVGGYAAADPVGLWWGQVTLGGMAVHVFFVLSGFLITRSALQSPSLGRFLWHRFLRIYPAFWVCLLVTAFVFTPLLAWATNYPGDWLARGTGASATGYLKSNWTLRIHQPIIGPLWGPNGSLWTLWPEMQCYLLVGALAIFSVLSLQRGAVLLLTLAVAGYVALHALQPQTPYLPRLPLLHDSSHAWLLLFFLVGACFYLYREAVVVNGRMALGSAILLVLGWKYTCYILVAPVALGYLALWLAVRLPVRRFAHYGDFSYGVYLYGYPIQALLTLTGFAAFGFWPYLTLSLALSVALAALSYHLVEKHALRLKAVSFNPLRWWGARPAEAEPGEVPLRRSA